MSDFLDLIEGTWDKPQPVRVSVSGATLVRPGDTLVLEVGRWMTVQAAERYREALAQHLPDVRVVFITAHVGAVFRPDREEVADHADTGDAGATATSP